MAQQQTEEHTMIENSSHVDTRVEHMAARWFEICCLELRGAHSFATCSKDSDTIYAQGLVSFDSGEAAALYGKLENQCSNQTAANHPVCARASACVCVCVCVCVLGRLTMTK